MAKTERNARCPCGSGSKYKKCCLPTDQAAAMERWARQEAEAAAERERLSTRTFREDPLDELNRNITSLIRKRRFDEAHEACRHLRDEFPEEVDGMDRQGDVYKAMGELELARECFQQALDFVLHDGSDERPGWYRDEIAELDAKLAAAPK